MIRRFRYGTLVVAATLQLAAPLAAYARVVEPMMRADFCSAAIGSDRRGEGREKAPPVVPAPHHCADASCCVGSAVDVLGPIRSPSPPPPAIGAAVTLPSTSRFVGPASIVAAAPPRGPPLYA